MAGGQFRSAKAISFSSFQELSGLTNTEKSDLYHCRLNALKGNPSLFFKEFDLLKANRSLAQRGHYHIALSVLAKTGKESQFWELFQEMEKFEHLKPTASTFNISLSLYKNRDPKQAEEIGRKLIHSKNYDKHTISTLMNIYTNQRKYEEAISLFESKVLNGKCDLVLANQYLFALGKSGNTVKTTHFFSRMKKLWNLTPDIHTFNMLLDVFGKNEDIQMIQIILELMHKTNVEWNAVTFRTLMTVFGMNAATWENAVVVYEDYESNVTIYE